MGFPETRHFELKVYTNTHYNIGTDLLGGGGGQSVYTNIQ